MQQLEHVIIGVDPHKLSATIEVVDGHERMLGSGRFATDRAGYAAMRMYAKAWPARVWAVEGANGVGRRIKFRGPGAPWITVVGVVADVKHYGLEKPMRPGVYFPAPQDPRSSMMIAVRTAGDPAAMTPAVRDVLRQMDPEIPLFRVRTMEDLIRQSMAQRAALSWMLAVFASLAFVLAIGGAYGVAMYLVTQRTREIGIRVALGARTGDIFRSVVASGLGVVLIGVALGVAASVSLAGLLGDALFGVSTHDLSVLSFVTVVLLSTALLANGLPARRAARIDPMRSLRTE